MFVLQWNHTRKGTPQTRTFKTFGQAWLLVLQVRFVCPDHPFMLNGKAV